MSTPPAVYPLKGTVQHYAWGGYHFLPNLLSINNEEKKPFAEYWLGAQGSQSATIEVHGETKKLADVINENKEALLGTEVTNRFQKLPYLLKILDVRQMLSIQVHPSKTAAEKGFAEENEKGIEPTAFNRNYKDDNHKPELMVALSDFWLLHGFKPEAALKEILETVPDFSFLLPAWEGDGYKGLYRQVMTLEQEKVDAVLGPVIDRIMPLYKNGELKKGEEAFWAARAAESFCKDGKMDRGIFSIYFFNVLHLKRGEGIYQAAGMPHAYLEGQNVEIMAASDNVLRAGLTDKYIDIDELMKHVQFEATHPQIITEKEMPEMIYSSPAAEFELSRLQLNEVNTNLTANGPQTGIVLEGALTLQSNNRVWTFKKGDAFFIPHAVPVQGSGNAQIFKAKVPRV